MAGILDALVNVVLLLVILVGLVVIHEFGHFVTARLARVRVHEFGIGFPPRAKVFARDSETIYTLNWLPIGGFVRLEGEEGESDDPRSFVRQPLRTRLVILLAGVTMNFLLAIVIMSLIAGFADPTTSVKVYDVPADDDGTPSPAQVAGIRGGRQVGVDATGEPIFDESGDTILAIDGIRFTFLDGPDGPTRYMRENPGKTVTLTVQNVDGTQRDVQVKLRGHEELHKGALGIRPRFVPGAYLTRDPVEATRVGVRRTVDACTLILRGLADLVANLTRPPVAGPIGIAQAVGTVRTEYPPVFLAYFIAVLSANLAVVNILPFPPMDGGRIAVSLVQALTGNRVSVALERAVYLTGFVLLMALVVWISYFDIQRLATPGT